MNYVDKIKQNIKSEIKDAKRASIIRIKGIRKLEKQIKQGYWFIDIGNDTPIYTPLDYDNYKRCIDNLYEIKIIDNRNFKLYHPNYPHTTTMCVHKYEVLRRFEKEYKELVDRYEEFEKRIKEMSK